MPADRMAADRRIARVIASYDEHAALTEVERAAIILAREILTALDEIDRLRAQLNYTGNAA